MDKEDKIVEELERTNPKLEENKKQDSTDKEDEILEELKKTNRLLEEQKDEVTPFQAVMDMVKSLLLGVLIVGPILAIIIVLFQLIGSWL